MKVSQEIEVMENQRKKKGNALFPREEEIIIKVRITSRKKEEKGEKCKEEESKENQEEEIKIEPRQEKTHATNN